MFEESIKIFDDFYQDPDQVRINVLARNDWGHFGNFPGIRTNQANYDDALYLRNFFEENVLNRRIDDWQVGSNTCYQLCYEWDTTWVHHDHNDWAGVLYLTPEAPVESGTGFFRHKKTGVDRFIVGNSNTDFNGNREQCADLNNWEKIAECGNLYNRLIVYNGRMYHRSMLPGFGNSLESARLTQNFFFNTSMRW